MGDLARDTVLEGGDGRYRATLSSDWEIWGPNGGYLAVIALRAAGAEARVPRPSSFSAHFLSVARFEAVDVEVETLKRGRRAESFRVAIRQEGRPVVEALVRTAAEGPGLEHRFGEAPDAPDPETLKSLDELFDPDWDRYAFWDNLDGRPTRPERYLEEPRARDPRLVEWYRFRPAATFDDPFLEAGRSLLLLDTMSWPAASRPHPDSPFQAPNLDVAAWFHADPAGSEWLLVDYECRTAGAGLMGTTGRVWSRDGRLLASGGAQLYCVPRPT
jgi:acyl-CoA thioesterase II